MTTAEKLVTIYENVEKTEELNAELEQTLYGTDSGGKSFYDEFWDEFQDYGKARDLRYFFAGRSWTPTNFKPKYDIISDSSSYMFMQTARLTCSLIDVCKTQGIIFDVSKASQLSNAFAYSGITELPHIDASGCNTASAIAAIFGYATNLRKIEKFTVKPMLTYTSVFLGCTALEEIEFAGVIANSISVQWCTQLTHDSLMSLIDCLKDYSGDTSGTTYTVTLGTDNIAKLTEAEIQKIHSKGWNIG
jgi:hypothetical protein